MPAGLSWPTYLKYFSAAMLTMILGAQTVHSVYKPLGDLDELVEAELQRKKIQAEIIKHQI